MSSKQEMWPVSRNCGDSNVLLKMNECCLDILSDLNSSSKLYVRSLKCSGCNFTLEKPVIEPGKVTSFVLNTNYPIEFYIENMKQKICQKLYSFGDMGKYSVNVSQNACGEIEEENAPESIWLNFGFYMSIFITLAIAHSLYRCVRIKKCLQSIRGQTSFQELEADLGNPDARQPSEAFTQTRKRRNSRIATLDVFRGIAISLMIFVNYGGGGYSFFKHSPWDGLTVADVIFPWFIWCVGVSIPLSLRSTLRNSVARIKVFQRIIIRSLILIGLGLVLNSGSERNLVLMKGLDSFSSLRFPGVLQRIGITYFIVALTELVFIKPQRNEQFGPWSFWADIKDSIIQWVIALFFVAAHEMLTFMLPVPGCPTGYLGPGGWHEHSKFENCTGGSAGYIDRLVLKNNHLYQHPTCQKIYHTRVPYDPEGLLGTMTCIFCAFLGVQAGRIILYYENASSRIRRWLIWGGLLGLIGGLLCNFYANDGPVPVNKNLWSISYVCVTSSLAFITFSCLYWLIDYRRIMACNVFLYAGMNALFLYVGHEVFKKYLPWSWKPFTETHGELLGMNLVATIIWLTVAYFLYSRNVFIVL